MNFNFPFSCEQKYPLGEFVHADLPNDYDPDKVSYFMSCNVACHISKTSLSHRTWYIPRDNYLEFMNVIISGKVNRLKHEDKRTKKDLF